MSKGMFYCQMAEDAIPLDVCLTQQQSTMPREGHWWFCAGCTCPARRCLKCGRSGSIADTQNGLCIACVRADDSEQKTLVSLEDFADRVAVLKAQIKAARRATPKEEVVLDLRDTFVPAIFSDNDALFALLSRHAVPSAGNGTVVHEPSAHLQREALLRMEESTTVLNRLAGQGYLALAPDSAYAILLHEPRCDEARVNLLVTSNVVLPSPAVMMGPRIVAYRGLSWMRENALLYKLKVPRTLTLEDIVHLYEEGVVRRIICIPPSGNKGLYYCVEDVLKACGVDEEAWRQGRQKKVRAARLQKTAIKRNTAIVWVSDGVYRIKHTREQWAHAHALAVLFDIEKTIVCALLERYAARLNTQRRSNEHGTRTTTYYNVQEVEALLGSFFVEEAKAMMSSRWHGVVYYAGIVLMTVARCAQALRLPDVVVTDRIKQYGELECTRWRRGHESSKGDEHCDFECVKILCTDLLPIRIQKAMPDITVFMDWKAPLEVETAAAEDVEKPTFRRRRSPLRAKPRAVQTVSQPKIKRPQKGNGKEKSVYTYTHAFNVLRVNAVCIREQWVVRGAAHILAEQLSIALVSARDILVAFQHDGHIACAGDSWGTITLVPDAINDQREVEMRRNISSSLQCRSPWPFQPPKVKGV